MSLRSFAGVMDTKLDEGCCASMIVSSSELVLSRVSKTDSRNYDPIS